MWTSYLQGSEEQDLIWKAFIEKVDGGRGRLLSPDECWEVLK